MLITSSRWTLFLLLLMTCASFSGCVLDAVDSVDTDELSYNTSEQSRLYFENVRREAYDVSRMPDTRIDMYRHELQDYSPEAPVVNLAIANNLMKEEAYIMAEPSPTFVYEDSLQLFWLDPGNQEEGSFWLNPEDFDSHFLFAGNLFNNLLQKHVIYYDAPGVEKVYLFPDEEQREVYLQVMKDYYELIELL